MTCTPVAWHAGRSLHVAGATEQQVSSSITLDAPFCVAKTFPVGQAMFPEPDPPMYSLLHVSSQHVSLFTFVDAPLLLVKILPGGQLMEPVDPVPSKYSLLHVLLVHSEPLAWLASQNWLAAHTSSPHFYCYRYPKIIVSNI